MLFVRYKNPNPSTDSWPRLAGAGPRTEGFFCPSLPARSVWSLPGQPLAAMPLLVRILWVLLYFYILG
jgi:hypothetical protein